MVPIPLYQWIAHEFTVQGRGDFVALLAPLLSPYLHRGSRVLDLCCGAGPFSFFFEERGAAVTAIDNAPFMIDLAVEEARRRGSHVDFLLADVLNHDFGTGQYDLVAFLGNTLSDFPAVEAFELARRVKRSLRRHGRFAVHYIDGFFPFVQEAYSREGIQQKEPFRVTRRFKAYDAQSGSYVETYRNETTGESVDYTSYLYHAPFVRSLFGQHFPLEISFALSERSFLDIYRKR